MGFFSNDTTRQRRLCCEGKRIIHEETRSWEGESDHSAFCVLHGGASHDSSLCIEKYLTRMWDALIHSA